MDNYTQKPSKTILPLFSLLNFLYSKASLSYDLTLLDKLILIGIFKHYGYDGVYISQKTLAEELNVSLKTIEKAIKHLKLKKILMIKKVGRKNYYELLISEYRFGNDDLIPRHTAGYRESIPRNSEHNTPQSRTYTIENIKENKRYSKNELKQTAQFWEPGNPDYDRVNMEKISKANP